MSDKALQEPAIRRQHADGSDGAAPHRRLAEAATETGDHGPGDDEADGQGGRMETDLGIGQTELCSEVGPGGAKAVDDVADRGLGDV